MKRYLCVLLLFLLSCTDSDDVQTTVSKKQSTLPASLETFADSLVRLDQYALESITKAGDYYHRLVPADSNLADSAAVMFLRHVAGVAYSVNQQFLADTADYFDLVYNDGKDVPPYQNQLKEKLARHHINLQGDGEGGVYAVPDYGWINQLLLPKTSAAVDQYLLLTGKEEKEPALLDAALAIDMKELVERLMASENLLQQKLPKNFEEDVIYKNKVYTGVLLFGSDNSSALEDNEISLTEQFKKGYDFLLATYPASKAAQVVKEWQQIVAQKDREKMEEWKTLYNRFD
jgi:hypothetical protein